MYRLSQKLFSFITKDCCNIYNCNNCNHKMDSVDCLGNEIDRIVLKELRKLFDRLKFDVNSNLEILVEDDSNKGRSIIDVQKLNQLIDNLLKESGDK